jgi:MSHA biogenesis protein MshO
MKRSLRRLRPAHGFTLVEAVIVIVIIGIIGAIVAVFIRAPILGYRNTVDRAELTDQADLALRRMARDIRLALPNSVRVMTTANNGDALEFLQTKSGGRYVSAEDGLPAPPPLNFDDKTKTSFGALAPTSTFFSQVGVNDYVVVYNLGEDFAPANAYDLRQSSADPRCPSITKAGNIACITGVVKDSILIDGNKVDIATISLHGNPFALQDVPLASPQQRFQVVSGPVSYYCEKQADGTSILWRAWDYRINATQTIPPATEGKRAMVASRLTGCAGIFSYGDAASASRRAGLVVIALAFRGRTEGAGTIRLVHQVHVDNTP